MLEAFSGVDTYANVTVVRFTGADAGTADGAISPHNASTRVSQPRDRCPLTIFTLSPVA